MDTPLTYRPRAQYTADASDNNNAAHECQIFRKARSTTLHAMRFRLRWLLFILLLLPWAALAQSPEQSATGRDVLTIDELTCRGNLATSCDFILGHIYLAPGDSVDEVELSNARLRLASLPSFDSVDIYLERGIARGHVRVIVEVVEADPYLREWLAGTSLRFDSASQLLAGRLTHQNLFGTGKLLDLTVYAYAPLDGLVRSEYGGRLQYVDPHWRDDKRTYLIAGVSGAYLDSETINGTRAKAQHVGVDVTVGRRIFDFSFLSLGYRYITFPDVRITGRSSDGSDFRFDVAYDRHNVTATYGWNSEDDPYFPTRGSRAVLHWSWVSTEHDMITEGGIRKTWTTDNGTSWVMQVADTPSTEYRSFVDEHFEFVGGFSRPIGGSADGEIQRGRWYVETGYSPQGHSLRGERQKEYGVKAGVRLQTRSFGMVDLYVIGSGLHTDRSAE
ncbi:MAG TPA: BamA/TamA family outer membrane protein [Steroidobacter sp.]|uniref:BamA/TamA family outer membrane protein n=1 Tax=Steroidobacter sp. TaxID=1978227 RepID=UPI002ED97227